MLWFGERDSRMWPASCRRAVHDRLLEGLFRLAQRTPAPALRFIYTFTSMSLVCRVFQRFARFMSCSFCAMFRLCAGLGGYDLTVSCYIHLPLCVRSPWGGGKCCNIRKVNGQRVSLHAAASVINFTPRSTLPCCKFNIALLYI